MSYLIQPSTRKDKKYMVLIDNKKLHFGAAGMSDFTIHKDEKRKDNYISRHQKNENWNDIKTAGFWSRWILWNLPSLEASVKDTNKRFNINIKLDL